MLLGLKIALSIAVGVALLYPFLRPEAQGGVLDELRMFGPIGGLAAVSVFLLLAVLYARDLARTLAMVSPASRKAEPRSVWLMLLLPYNFIEDFFIVANVAKSLESEAAENAALSRFKSFGLVSGFGWCSAQIVSLLPNEVGSVAGVVAILLWVWHWAFIRRALRALACGDQSNNSSQPTPLRGVS
jgi:hypothetical protein